MKQVKRRTELCFLPENIMRTTTQTSSSDTLEDARQLPTLAKAPCDSVDTHAQQPFALSESFIKLQQLLYRQPAERLLRLTRLHHHGHRLAPQDLSLQGENIDLHISALPQHTLDDLLVASRLRHAGAQRQRVAKLQSDF